MVNTLVFSKWQTCIAPIDRATTGINKMLNMMTPATLKNMTKTNQIRLNISRRIFN